MTVISFQLLPTQEYFHKWFKLDEEGDSPLNDNFSSLGYQSLYIVQNMGTLVIVMLLPIIQFFAGVILSFLWEGSYTKTLYTKIRNFLFFNGTFSYLNETFIVLLTCCCIGTIYLRFDTLGNAINSILVIVLVVILICFPFVVALIYGRADVYKKIISGQREFLDRFGELVKSLNFKRRGRQVVTYLVISLLRRLLLVVTVVYAQNYPVFSLFSINFQTLIVVITSGFVEPHRSVTTGRMEFLNEAFVLLTQYHLMCFTPFVVDHE